MHKGVKLHWSLGLERCTCNRPMVYNECVMAGDDLGKVG